MCGIRKLFIDGTDRDSGFVMNVIATRTKSYILRVNRFSCQQSSGDTAEYRDRAKQHEFREIFFFMECKAVIFILLYTTIFDTQMSRANAMKSLLYGY